MHGCADTPLLRRRESRQVYVADVVAKSLFQVSKISAVLVLNQCEAACLMCSLTPTTGPLVSLKVKVRRLSSDKTAATRAKGSNKSKAA